MHCNFQGNSVQLSGNFPSVGSPAADFNLVDSELNLIKLADIQQKNIILNIYPSVDTGVCAASTIKFNQEAAGLEDTVILCVSRDLPFAHKRFCSEKGISHIKNTSTYRGESFGEDYGVMMKDGPLAGLFARAVVLIQNGVVTYTELVDDIVHEPNYEAVLAKLK